MIKLYSKINCGLGPYAETKGAGQMIRMCTFNFATWIEQFIFYSNLEIEASS